MSYRPSRSFVAVLITSLVLAGGAGYKLYRYYHPSAEMDQGEQFVNNAQWLHGFKDSHDPAQQAKYREVIAKAEAWRAQLVAQNPELAVTYKDVPDDRNGYLQLVRYMKQAGKNELRMPNEIEAILDNQAPWEEARVEAWLGEQRAVLGELRRIGALRETSVKNQPLEDTVTITSIIRPIRNSARMLMLEARALARKGDQEGALMSIRAAVQLGHQIDELETPTLLHLTVAILIRQEVQKQVMGNILPALPKDRVDFAAWQAVSSGVAPQKEELPHMFRGEWHATASYWLLPMLAYEGPKDSQALAEAFTEDMVKTIRQYRSTTLPVQEKTTLSSEPPEHLSKKSREIYHTLMIGSSAWCKGWTRAEIMREQSNAAFAVLKGEAMPVEPVTGQPFVWNEAERTLSLPSSDRLAWAQVAPLKVPKL